VSLAVGDIEAHPVTELSGNVNSPPIRDEPEWSAVDELALTPIHRELVMALLNGGEPTWILRRMQTSRKPSRVDRALEELEERKLVYRTWEVSGEPGRVREMDDWWALTDEAWDSLGLIRRPGYR
jgi:hypothetical protein